MDAFDRALLLGLNHYAHRWLALDAFVAELSRSDLLKGGVVLGVTWWLWFTLRPDVRAVRARLLATLLGGAAAVLAGRLLAILLPFRARPIHEPGLGFVLPYGQGTGQLQAWSSFPSDHVMLFAALSIGVLFVSRSAGFFLLIWTVVVISLPRLFLGLHYPSDLLAGALIGAAIACVMQIAWLRGRLTRPLLAWLDRHPASFYAMMYLATLQIGTLFSDVRRIALLVQIALHLRPA